MHRFTRKELYELVWSEPMKTLAGRFELSDVGMAKACKRANISRPPRGYWAKFKAGKKVSRQPLPARGPGMSNEIEVGGSRYYCYRQDSEKEILASNLHPPTFEDDIKDVAVRVRALVGHVSCPKFPERAHRQIRGLLDADEDRRQKLLTSGYALYWDKPLFNDAFENRRLRVLNAIMTALEQKGMKPSVSGRDARNLCVSINGTTIQYTLDATTQKHNSNREASKETRGTSNKLRLQILTWGPSSNIHLSWEDTDKAKLEKHFDDILVELIVSGERQYRKVQQRHYEWAVERKANLIEEIQERREEAVRKERERRVALEEARINRLLADAAALQQASIIRSYVEAVRIKCTEMEHSISTDRLKAWANWALSEADRIDPIQSGHFLNRLGAFYVQRKV